MDKIKILVVDDESRMRKLVHDFLAREGYEVLEAGDGEEALDIFYQQKDIALLVLDIMMPRINVLRYAVKSDRLQRCRLLCLQLRAMSVMN